MVEWFRRKLMDYGFSFVLTKQSASIESMPPKDGESDQEYLMRLILTESPK
ncbi:MAG: hypothetical protein WDZ91_01800 [Paenibacillaceae bacterium]